MLLQEAVRLADDDSEPLNALCQHLFEMDDYQAALPALKRLAEMEPDNPSVYQNLGAVYARLLQFEEAEAAYRRTILLRPNSADALLHLGYVLKQTGRIGEAIDAWQRCRALPNVGQNILDSLRTLQTQGLLPTNR
jgi:Flp pilus assembly protein TadD